MGDAEIQQLRDGYEAVTRGDWDNAFLELGPDIELRPADRAPVPDAIRGREQVTAFAREMLAPFEQVEVEPEQFIDGGDRIVVFLLVRLRPRGSNALVENRIAHLWRLDQGRFDSIEVFPVREQALEAAALPAPES